jgi:hypothetical protein
MMPAPLTNAHLALCGLYAYCGTPAHSSSKPPSGARTVSSGGGGGVGFGGGGGLGHTGVSVALSHGRRSCTPSAVRLLLAFAADRAYTVPLNGLADWQLSSVLLAVTTSG